MVLLGFRGADQRAASHHEAAVKTTVKTTTAI
jgi:hypothetical protein